MNKYLALGFIAGFSVMCLELSASRLLAPYFGASIFVWTNVIGVVLGSLSFGYYLGGRLSEKQPALYKLQRLLLASGILVLAVPWLIHPLASGLISLDALKTTTSSLVTGGSLVVICVLFGLPMVLLGSTTPYVIKLLSLDSTHVGSTSGKLFAISTLGSLLGTFLPTLVLIPNFGTRNTVLAAGMLLVIAGSPAAVRLQQKAGVITIAVLLAALGVSQTRYGPSTIYATDSAYQHIRVVEFAEGSRYMLFDAGFGVQSVYHPHRILTGNAYYDFFSILPQATAANSPKLNVLLLGLAGGTIARQLHHFYGEKVNLTGVELDPAVLSIAKQYFSLDNLPLKMYNQDARLFLRQTTEQYDIIIVDVYHNEFEIPWNMTTKEFWGLVAQKLTPNGLAAMNVATSTKNQILLQALTNTQLEIFKNVYITSVHGPDQAVGNYIITMANTPADFSSLTSTNTELQSLIGRAKNTTQAAKKPGVRILTDDRAPVDLLTAQTLWEDIR